MKSIPDEPNQIDYQRIRNRFVGHRSSVDILPKPDELSVIDKSWVKATECDLPSKMYSCCKNGWHMKRAYNSSHGYWYWSAYQRCPKSKAAQTAYRSSAKPKRGKWGKDEE